MHTEQSFVFSICVHCHAKICMSLCTLLTSAKRRSSSEEWGLSPLLILTVMQKGRLQGHPFPSLHRWREPCMPRQRSGRVSWPACFLHPPLCSCEQLSLQHPELAIWRQELITWSKVKGWLWCLLLVVVQLFERLWLACQLGVTLLFCWSIGCDWLEGWLSAQLWLAVTM